MPWSPPQFLRQNWHALLEIALFTFGFYQLYRSFRGTRGARVLTGLALFMTVLAVLGRLLELPVTLWLLERQMPFLLVILAVIFQPELRRYFTELGSRRVFAGREQSQRTLERLCDCVFELARRHAGALIAIERDTGLRSYAETGVGLDAVFSGELLTTIFHPKTSLHDGGLILRNERVVAAACIFPVSQRESLDRSFGLRHRAGLGLCEETDAIAVVVSEETGSVSLCYNARIERDLTAAGLRERLRRILFEGGDTSRPSTLADPPESAADDDTDLDAT